MMIAVEAASEQLGQLDNAFDTLMANADTRVEAYLVQHVDNMPHEFQTADPSPRDFAADAEPK